MRGIAAAGGVILLVLGSRLASKHGGPNSASAAEALFRMEKLIPTLHGFHESYWQAEGEFQQGDLKLLDQVWYENGEWRMTSSPARGGDRILKQEGSVAALYQRAMDGSVSKYVNSGLGDTEVTLKSLLHNAGIEGAEKDAQSLGISELDGHQVEQIYIPTYESQRSYVWLLVGSERPVRFLRQNLSSGVWHDTWRYDIEYADAWAASVFDVKTLSPSTVPSPPDPTLSGAVTQRSPIRRFAGADGVMRDWTVETPPDSIPAVGTPSYRTGNFLFHNFVYQKLPANTISELAAICTSQGVADSVKSLIEGEISRYGTIAEYGSKGEIDESSLSGTQTFDLWFGKHNVTADVQFVRKVKGPWRVSGITLKDGPVP